MSALIHCLALLLLLTKSLEAITGLCLLQTYQSTCPTMAIPLAIQCPNLLLVCKQTFSELQKILGEQIAIPQSIFNLHRPTFDRNSKHACSRECCNYPVQTDSSSCGVMAFMFVATVSFGPNEVWPYVRLPQIQCHPLKSLLCIYHQPSAYAHYLRTVLAVWLVRGKIDIQNVVSSLAFDNKKTLPKPLQENRNSRLFSLSR